MIWVFLPSLTNSNRCSHTSLSSENTIKSFFADMWAEGELTRKLIRVAASTCLENEPKTDMNNLDILTDPIRECRCERDIIAIRILGEIELERG